MNKYKIEILPPTNLTQHDEWGWRLLVQPAGVERWMDAGFSGVESNSLMALKRAKWALELSEGFITPEQYDERLKTEIKEGWLHSVDATERSILIKQQLDRLRRMRKDGRDG